MGHLQQLFRLQQIDTEIREKKQRLSEVLQAQKETEALLAARQRAETAVATLQKHRTQHKQLTDELNSIVAKRKRSEQRLYSGNVKNPKELSDLQHEIESLERRRSTLEDQILEAMIAIEEAEAEKETAEAELATIENEWQNRQAYLKEEQHTLALRLHTLAGERQKCISQIPEELLNEYQTLSQRKNGTAVAELKQNICQGCRLTVSEQQIRDARAGKKVHCNNCGRILYSG